MFDPFFKAQDCVIKVDSMPKTPVIKVDSRHKIVSVRLAKAQDCTIKVGSRHNVSRSREPYTFLLEQMETTSHRGCLLTQYLLSHTYLLTSIK